MISVRDKHLEKQIDRVREARQDKTMAKTLCDIAREWLAEQQAYARLDDDGSAHPNAIPESKEPNNSQSTPV